MKSHQTRLLSIVLVFALVLSAMEPAALVTANQSPEPLTGNWVVRTDNKDGTFRFDFTLSGRQGYHIARVREVGADGSLSPERIVAYRINCSAPVKATVDQQHEVVHTPVAP